MVVIGIVAILATLAVPSYLEKLIRDQVVEALPLADVAKPPIGTEWATTQSFLRAAVVEDAPVVPVTWVCGYAMAPNKMTIKGTNNTGVASRYLPLKCR